MRVLLFLLLSLFMLPAFSADNLLRWHDAQHFTVQASMPLKAKRAWKLCALYPSLMSGKLSAMERAFRVGEIIRIASARISQAFTYKGIKYTRLNYVKLQT